METKGFDGHRSWLRQQRVGSGCFCSPQGSFTSAWLTLALNSDSTQDPSCQLQMKTRNRYGLWQLKDCYISMLAFMDPIIALGILVYSFVCSLLDPLSPSEGLKASFRCVFCCCFIILLFCFFNSVWMCLPRLTRLLLCLPPESGFQVLLLAQPFCGSSAGKQPRTILSSLSSHY